MQVPTDFGIDPQNDSVDADTSRNIAYEVFQASCADALGSNVNSWLGVRRGDPELPYGDFKRISRSGDLPDDIFMVGAHEPTEAAEMVRTAILANEEDVTGTITACEENDKSGGMDLVAIEDGAYDDECSL